MSRGLVPKNLGQAITRRSNPVPPRPFQKIVEGDSTSPQPNQSRVESAPASSSARTPTKESKSTLEKSQITSSPSAGKSPTKAPSDVSSTQPSRQVRTRPSESFVARSKPDHHLNARRVLRGEPRSFAGKRAYLFPSGRSRTSLEPVRWAESFTLLVGSSPKTPTFVKPNPRVDAMTNYIQVASTPTADTGSSLLLHFDHRRYLFGHLSEGTQRALSQRKLPLAKLETLFLSGQTKWENTGGMIGMMLTVADVLDGSRREIEQQNAARKKTGKAQLPLKGPERLEIHGSRNLAYSIGTARGFVFRKGLPIRPIEVDKDPRIANPKASTPDWEDDAIQVWKVPVIADEPSLGRGTSRKRSHEDMVAEDKDLQNRPAGLPSLEEQHNIDQEAINTVVEDMFSSNWTMDALCETKLHQVELPATIFVRKDGQIQRYTGPLPGSKDDVPDIDVLVRFPWPATKVRTLPPPKSASDMSVCYVVKNRGRRGKFNPAVAKQLGVKPTDFKLLAAGQSVTGAEGNEVTPEMVLEAPLKPSGFAVLDIPSISAVESFINRPEWKNSALMDNVPIFYWLLGSQVVDDPRVQNFMKERPDVKHVVMSSDTCPNMVAMESYALLLTKLRRIDADRFPLLEFNNTCRDLSSIGPNVETGRTGMKAFLSPAFNIKDNEIVPFPTFQEANNVPEEVLALADQARAAVKEPKFLADIEQSERDIPNRDAEIIPLGTGSALPSKYRNVSATLIRIPQYGNYLLDCGENTLGQLRRAFPAEEVTKILQDLRCVFISHMHADHHLGLVSIVRAWSEATAHLDSKPKLGLISPSSMHHFMREYSKIDEIDLDRVVFHRPVWPESGDGRLPDNDPTGLSAALLVPVNHCVNAYAGVLTWPSGLKIAYSGDCRPSDNFVKVGKGATLLIHESTFDDDKLSDAKAKKHSTMSEALDVGYRMGARRVLLTHFSQRYAKVPIIEKRETENGADQAVLLAFDQMRVKLGEFKQAQTFLPAIRRYFELDSE
ncbi:tRNA processing endoribonuclease [Colletotrichum truncatum]|uniref:tRNA processing endoribonuclease n=1 Tax=Colletotrichum truncatum TaxID=5467 RepID=A0ACC3YJP1_COLTU|nr:tRNA processing endoribonuclease [Colletotrichum truncatum]KAF6797326.1 tRNA processing endoribonuclease [Colletotrichum truncatum]